MKNAEGSAPRASLRSRISKIQQAWGSTKAARHSRMKKAECRMKKSKAAILCPQFCILHSIFCISFRGRGRQAMHLPCKQVNVGALPTGSTNFE